MATSEERLKVLKMVQEGKITAEMAAELLKALDVSVKKPDADDLGIAVSRAEAAAVSSGYGSPIRILAVRA